MTESIYKPWGLDVGPEMQGPRDDAPQEMHKTCGSCLAGICIMNGMEIERCDDCRLFATDEAAVEVVQALLDILHLEYRGMDSTDTVLSAVKRLRGP